jgi:hypothetical protein
LAARGSNSAFFPESGKKAKNGRKRELFDGPGERIPMAAYTAGPSTLVGREAPSPQETRMRWYVSRNGETHGPLDEAQVVHWFRGGMHDAMVRDEAGGPWTPILQSPIAGAHALARLQPVQVPALPQCRNCGAVGSMQIQSSSTAGGWLFFILMFVICLPVAIIGLFQKRTYSACSNCGARAW